MSKATSLGNLSLVLQVPRTCENFVILCKRGYYDGTGVWGGVGCVLAWGEEGRKWFLATSCCDGAEVWCYQRSCPGLPSSVSRLPFSSPSSLALLPFVPCVSLLPLSPLSFPSFLPLPYSFPPSSLSLSPPCSISPIHQEFHGMYIHYCTTDPHSISTL